MAAFPDDPSSAACERLSAWFTSRGGTLSGKCAPQAWSGETGLFATGAVAKGDTLASIPLSMCVTPTLPTSGPLAPLAGDTADWPADETLALRLMAERKLGKASRHAAWLECVPAEFDLPIWWSPGERAPIKGTIVCTLAEMMARQMKADWDSLYQPLVAKHVKLLEGLDENDYLWAMTVIWSRAFGIYVPDGRGGEDVYVRVVAPLLDMANHDAALAVPLDDALHYSVSEEALVLSAAHPAAAGQQCFISYGPYSNAKLLYSYGFAAIRSNPRSCVDLWINVPSHDPMRGLKESLLREKGVQPSYDFTGTLFLVDDTTAAAASEAAEGSGAAAAEETDARAADAATAPSRRAEVSPALLALLRVAQARPEEHTKLAKAFGSMISIQNEMAVYGTLIDMLSRKLKSAEQAQEGDGGSGDGGGDEAELEACLGALSLAETSLADADGDEERGARELTLRTLRRRAAAEAIIAEERAVLRGALALAQTWAGKLAANPSAYVPPDSR